MVTHKKFRHKQPWPEWQKKYLEKHYPAGDLEEIAAKLHRSVASIKSKAHNLRISRNVPGKRKPQRRQRSMILSDHIAARTSKKTERHRRNRR